MVAERAGEPFELVEALEVEFDAPVDERLFVFEPPAKERRRPASPIVGRDVSAIQASAEATFTVLVPEEVPEDWRLRCRLVEAREGSRLGGSVQLNYRTRSAHDGVRIIEAPADQPNDVQRTLERAPNWEIRTVGGQEVHVRRVGGSTQLWMTRGDTRVLMTSDSLSIEQVGDLASSMVPVPVQPGPDVVGQGPRSGPGALTGGTQH